MDIKLAKTLCDLDPFLELCENYTPQDTNYPVTTAVKCKSLMQIPDVLLNYTEYFIKHSGYALFYGEYLHYDKANDEVWYYVY